MRRFLSRVSAAGAAGVVLGLVLVAGHAAPPTEPQYHTWTATSGHKTEAQFIKLNENGTVTLKIKDGSTKDILLSVLVAADQDFARQLANGVAPPTATVPPKMTGPVATVASVEKEAQKCRTAKDAAQLYQVFLTDDRIGAEERQAAQSKLASWEDMAAKDMVRLGKAWLTPDEAEKIRKQTDDLFVQGVELVRLNNDQLAYETLLKASKLNPESLKADFTMALIFALVAHNAEKAKQHFEVCFRRDPDNVAVLNNLALIEIKLAQPRNAFQHWKKAVSLSSDPRIAQNIGRLLDLTGRRKISTVPKSSLDEISNLYAKLITSGGAPVADKKKGWMYMLLVDDRPAEKASAQQDPEGIVDSTIAASGTGFVVHPSYVLTNRHVAEDATGFELRECDAPRGVKLQAKVAAVSKVLDLALLHCPELTAPSVPLDTSELRRGTDILVLGYPEIGFLGATLKATRGAISALPSASINQMCLYDAVTNPGNSGGPICSNRAGVIAVHCAGYNLGGKYGAGIPITSALPFLEASISDFRPVNPAMNVVEWPDVDQKISKSTVLILVKKKQQDVGLAKRIGGSYLEDRTCVVCSSFQKVKCPAPGCTRGTVPTTIVNQEREPISGKLISETVPGRAQCNNCRGSGTVDCPHCTDGTDPNLR